MNSKIVAIPFFIATAVLVIFGVSSTHVAPAPQAAHDPLESSPDLAVLYEAELLRCAALEESATASGGQSSERRAPAATADDVFNRVRRYSFVDDRIGEYLETLGFSRAANGQAGTANFGSAANTGVIASNNRLLARNPCFAELSALFYDEIKIEDAEWLRARPERANNRIRGRSNINESCTSALGCQPGFLWSKALEYANGDHALAMQLIGICGHDDVSRDIGTAPRTLTYDFNQARRRNVTIGSPRIANPNQEFHRYLLSCPDYLSRMYIPGSLGAPYNIAPALRTRIAQVQAPTMGAGVIPAKYYHIVAGAFSSCLLSRRGVPGFIIERVQSTGIRAYRSRALCESQLWNEMRLRPLPTVESLVAMMRSASVGVPRDGEQKFIYRMLSRTPNFQKITNCNDIDIEGTTLGALRALSGRDCEGLPTDLCQRVLHRVQTWIVDFEWSAAQHAVGHRFASANCPSIGTRTDPIRNSCTALQHIISVRRPTN